MNPQHTTGPFSVYENAPGNKHRFLIHDSAGQTVAATTGDPDHAPDYYRALANARLIAAAPELLAALKVVREYMDHAADQFSDEDIFQIRAAIAKATGAA